MTMSRTAYLSLVVAPLFTCSVDDAPPANGCPCVAEFICRVQSKVCFHAETGPVEELGCIVYTDGMLYCTNRTNISLFEQPSASSRVVNHLLTTWSWFACWTPGERQSDGITTWYYTDGDERGAPNGWLPVANVDTSADFNADPAAWGFARCELPIDDVVRSAAERARSRGQPRPVFR